MTRRSVVCAVCMVVIALLGTRAWAVNSVEVASLRAAKSQSGVEVRVKLTNDITARTVTIPLVVRAVSGTAYITSLKLGFGDRLPPSGGPLDEIKVTNQYDAEDGACKQNFPGGFASISSLDTLPQPVTGSPVGAMLTRGKLFSPALVPGSDATGSLRLIMDINGGQGSFEIDSTCTNPANHLVFVEAVTNVPYTPTFTKGVIDVGYKPDASDTAWSTQEDAAKSVSYLPATDGDSDPLTFAIISGPSNGVVSGFNASTGGFLYTPAAEYNGLDSLEFTATDGFEIDSAVVRITVTSVNDPPVAKDTTVTVDEDSQVSSSFQASDIDSPTLTYSLLGSPPNGGLTAFNPSTGAYTYEPDPNYFGTDQINFRATDGGGAFDDGVVTVIVNPINDPPIARDTAWSTLEDAAKSVSYLPTTDADSDPLTFTIISGPSNGVVSGFNTSTGGFLYTPAAEYSGLDSLEFSATDGSETDSGVVRITVTLVNDPPIAKDTTVTVDEDSQVSASFRASDIDSPTLTYSLLGSPSHGGLTAFDPGTGAYTYAPDPNYFGTDQINFRATDGGGAFDNGVVTVIVNPIDDPPVARDTAWSTQEDAAKSVSYLPATDDDSDPLTFTIISGPSNGVISGFNASTGGFLYTPAGEYNGLDSLEFSATDGSDIDSGMVRITVIPVNDPPIAKDTTVTVDEDSQVSSSFRASDVDNPTLTYSLLANPQRGALTAFDPNTGAYTYEPDPNYFGSDQINFRATDGGGAFDNGVVTIVVGPINDPPVARDSTLDVTRDVATEGQFHSYDIDGGAPTYAKVDGPQHGTFTGFNASTGTFTYTPAGGYFGPDSIRFTAFDGTDNSNLGVVRIEVDSVGCLCLWHMDPDHDGFMTAIDLARTIEAVFFGGNPYPPTPPCPVSALDFNCDTFVDVVDIASAISYIFFGGPILCDPCAPPGP